MVSPLTEATLMPAGLLTAASLSETIFAIVYILMLCYEKKSRKPSFLPCYLICQLESVIHDQVILDRPDAACLPDDPRRFRFLIPGIHLAREGHPGPGYLYLDLPVAQ